MSSHALLSSNSKLPLVEKKFLFHGHYLNILSKNLKVWVHDGIPFFYINILKFGGWGG